MESSTIDGGVSYSKLLGGIAKGGFGNSTSQSTVGWTTIGLSSGTSLGWSSDRMLDGRLKGIPDYDNNNRGMPLGRMEHEGQTAYSIVVHVGSLLTDEGIMAGKDLEWT